MREFVLQHETFDLDLRQLHPKAGDLLPKCDLGRQGRVTLSKHRGDRGRHPTGEASAIGLQPSPDPFEQLSLRGEGVGETFIT